MVKAKILLVDDEDEILKSVSMRLKANGYEVLTAVDGLEALGLAALEKPDLILLDIGLPKLSGHDVAKILKESGRTSGIPIVFFTAHTSPADYEKADELMVSRYITKPFHPEVLIKTVKDLVEHKTEKRQRIEAAT